MTQTEKLYAAIHVGMGHGSWDVVGAAELVAGFRAALAPHQAYPQPVQAVPDGFVLVPKEITPDIRRALFTSLVHADDEAYVLDKLVEAAALSASQGDAS